MVLGFTTKGAYSSENIYDDLFIKQQQQQKMFGSYTTKKN